MKLSIRKNRGDKRDVELIREAVPFILKRLLKAEQIEDIDLHITLVKLKNDFGDVEISSAPSFRLRLHHEMDTLLMIVTLAHELVHVSQVMNGRLKLKKINHLRQWYWDKRPYGTAPYDDPELTLPWESEAARLENELACRFFRHYVSKLNTR